jgi:hypothetical protein
MTKHFVPRRRTASRGIQSLAVVAAAVVALLLVWQLTGWPTRTNKSDDQPVVSGAGVPSAGPTRLTTRPSSRPPSSRAPRSKSSYVDESSPDGLVSPLRQRLAKATAAAEADGVRVSITSARRSAAKQQQLFDKAVAKYGSYRAASRWVLPPADSAHVKGRAVDLGPKAAMDWMDENGWRYGICRRYDNEPWHFEATTRPGNQCPPREPYAVTKSD